jgi:hypothetical protein
LARNNYHFEKRKKELARQKKSEEKRERRLAKKNPQPEGSPGASSSPDQATSLDPSDPMPVQPEPVADVVPIVPCSPEQVCKE